MDSFFTEKNCSRCGNQLIARIMSWFTDETICLACKKKEDEVRSFLPQNGAGYEGCGHVPTQCDHCNGYGSSLKDPVGQDKCTCCEGSGLKTEMQSLATDHGDARKSEIREVE